MERVFPFTLLFPAMLQCNAHHQLTDNPGIDNILLSIHDSIGIRDFAGQQVIGAKQFRTPYSESLFLRLLLSNGHTAIVEVHVSILWNPLLS